MRISDWSSDVCSSDLVQPRVGGRSLMAMSGPSGGIGGRRGRGNRRAPMAEINVTQLVDVMLVLLIIFMITAPLLTAAVSFALPESRATPVAPADPDPIQIGCDHD